MIEALPPQSFPDLRIVQMLGGLGRLDAETYGSDLTLRMAQALGAKQRLLPSPGIVASNMVRDSLLKDINIAESLELAAKADLAIVGLGVPEPGSVIMQAGILTSAELSGAARGRRGGRYCLTLFDAEGRAVDHAINDRIIGLDLEQIKRIPHVIGVAGGEGKFEVIRGAVCGDLVDVLITDERTANRLLKERVIWPHSRRK